MATSKYRRDVRGRFTKMGDSIEDIENVSATDVRRGMSVPRHAPEGDAPATGLVPARLATMVAPDDSARTVYGGPHGAWTRAAARSSGDPMDPSSFLTGADDGLTVEQRADVLAGQQAHVPTARFGDGGATMSPTRAQDIHPRRR